MLSLIGGSKSPFCLIQKMSTSNFQVDSLKFLVNSHFKLCRSLSPSPGFPFLFPGFTRKFWRGYHTCWRTASVLIWLFCFMLASSEMLLAPSCLIVSPSVSKDGNNRGTEMGQICDFFSCPMFCFKFSLVCRLLSGNFWAHSTGRGRLCRSLVSLRGCRLLSCAGQAFTPPTIHYSHLCSIIFPIRCHKERW